MNTIVDHTTVVDPEAMSKLLAEVDAIDSGHVVVVTPGEPFYETPVDLETRPADELRIPADTFRDELASDYRPSHYFADIYTTDGVPVPFEVRTEEWWDTVQAEYNDKHFPNSVPNSVVRLGKNYIAVGRGQWVTTGETTTDDGREAFTFTTASKVRSDERAAEEAELRNFLGTHPKVETPAWAKTVELNPEVDGTFELVCSARFGDIEVLALGLYTPETDEFTLDTPNFRLVGHEGVGLDELTKIITATQAELARVRAAVNEVTR
jgi:hypothetical protein